MAARFFKTVQNLNRLPEILRCQRHTKQWLELTSAYVGLKVHLPFKVNLRSGEFQFCELSDVATFWQIFYRKVYPVRASDYLIIDAGANIGAFTLFALQSAPRAKVIAIEPAPDSCSRVRSMLRDHNLESRCTLHEVALTKSIEQTTINLGVGSQFRRIGTPGHIVPSLTLDSLIPPGATVDLLKADIKGAEL
ncbi:MAG TPA: FkbM family methyltransferase [Bryobacteraceae bacterium]|nr:FkbM family methyltransferase [Bryobacteraceae bacterium]